MKVFLDTNILLDTILDRRPFSDYSTLILELGENRTVELYMSILSVPTIAYVIKNEGTGRKKEIIKTLISIVKPLPSLPIHVEDMLESKMSDIEDALQVQSAIEGSCDIIITRNMVDFKECGLPVIEPQDFITRVIQ